MIRFMVGGDTHGDAVCPASWKVFNEFKNDFKPHIRVHLGDLWNFDAIRRGASLADENSNIAEDWKMGIALLDEYRPTHFLAGNHDWRLWDLLDSTKAVVRDFAQEKIRAIQAKLKQRACAFLPYDARLGVLRFGELSIVHGYHTGHYSCRNHAHVYGDVLFGHTHAEGSGSVPGLTRHTAWNIGCLCLLDPKYMSMKTGKLNWCNGFAYGTMNEKTGSFTVFQAKSTDGVWTMGTDFKTYENKQ